MMPRPDMGLANSGPGRLESKTTSFGSRGGRGSRSGLGGLGALGGRGGLGALGGRGAFGGLGGRGGRDDLALGLGSLGLGWFP
ncbi:hypothetical protein PG996_010651 [Apiospora saccharicola]|uniref:Uncharacterized protein n=1 Tax=Apiospora saccharicola TaxID=335842 RepID=A0ABR1UP74_9PEZI